MERHGSDVAISLATSRKYTYSIVDLKNFNIIAHLFSFVFIIFLK